jgi:hypothetical protein
MQTNRFYKINFNYIFKHDTSSLDPMSWKRTRIWLVV